MAIAFYAPANWTSATNPTVTITSFAAGDEIIVVGVVDDAMTGSLATPTAAGLTFSLVTSIGYAGTGDAAAYLWRATAAGSGSNVVVTSVQAGSAQCGIGAYVRTGTAPSSTTLAGTHTAAAFSTAVAAGDDVIVGYSDYAALAAGRTQATGSGTPTERVDTASAIYGVWVGDWANCSAGTFSFGVASYAGTQIAQVGIVLAASAGATTVGQTHARFGVDDGSQSAHTWAAAEDANLTAVLGAQLLRVQLDTTGDVAATAWKLQAQKNGAGGYTDVPVGASVSEAWGTVTFGAIGTGANGGTTVAPSYPAGITAGQYLTCHVSSGATNSETPTAPSGWTLLATGASTDGAYGIDTGPRRMTVFGKVADGSESGTLTVAITNGGTCRGTIARWTKAGSGAWDVVGQGADDSTSGTAFSATTAAIDWHAGDAVIAAVGQRVDTVTQSAQALTAAGITFGARTNRDSTAVTTGNDHRHVVDTFAAVTGGSGSVAPTWAYTGSLACSGGLVVVRLREYTAPATNQVYVSASANIAAGGEATTARLSVPNAHSFTTGRRWDDENGSDAIDPAADNYTELEWSLATQAPATTGDYWDFRVAGLTTYTVTPRWTIGSAGSNFTRTQAGSAGLTDAVSRALASSRTQPSSFGLVDALGRALSSARTRADTVGLTDVAAPAVGWGRVRADTVGLTDALSASISRAVPVADTAGLTDVAVRFVSSGRARAESVGLTDAAARVVSHGRARADVAGMSDAVTAAIVLGRARADSAGLSDAVTAAISRSAPAADTVGLVDVAVRVVSAVRARAEAVGVSDLVARVVSAGRGTADLVGLVDVASRAAVTARARAESAGLVDAVTVAVALGRAKADTVGLTDVPARVVSSGRAGGDTAGMVDGLTRVATAVRGRADTVGITDAVTVTLATSGSRAGADTLGLTDAVGRALSVARPRADTAAISDAVSAALLRVRFGGDTAGITDAVSRVAPSTRVRADTVGLSDAVVVSLSGSAVRGRADTVGITDAAGRALAGFRPAGDPITLSDALKAVTGAVRAAGEVLGLTDAVVVALSGPSGIATHDLVGLVDAAVATLTEAATAPVDSGTVDLTSTEVERPELTSDVVELSAVSDVEQFGVVSDVVGFEVVGADIGKGGGPMGSVGIESVTDELLQARILARVDPTGTPPEWSVSTGGRSNPGAWFPGSWAGGWSARSGRAVALSPPIGVGQVLNVVPGVYDVFVKWTEAGRHPVKWAGELTVR